MICNSSLGKVAISSQLITCKPPSIKNKASREKSILRLSMVSNLIKKHFIKKDTEVALYYFVWVESLIRFLKSNESEFTQ